MESSKYEDAMEIAIQHLEGASLNVRIATVDRFEGILFPHEGEGLPRKWITKNNVTCVTTWSYQVLKDNIKLALFKEKFGLPPKHYFLLHNKAPIFLAKVDLILFYLPHEKFCVYPHRELLPRILSTPRWIERNINICT